MRRDTVKRPVHGGSRHSEYVGERLLSLCRQVLPVRGTMWVGDQGLSHLRGVRKRRVQRDIASAVSKVRQAPLPCDLPGYLAPDGTPPTPKLSLSELDAVIGDYFTWTHNARPHRETGAAPNTTRVGDGWLPRRLESLSDLDLPLVMVAKARREGHTMPFCLCFLVCLATCLATASPVAAQEFTNVVRHGNCYVGTIVDPMWDGSGAYMLCGSATPAFLVYRAPGDRDLKVGVQTELTKFAAENTPFGEFDKFSGSKVRFRVDRGDIFTGSAYLAPDGFLYWTDGTRFQAFLSQVRNRRRLYVSVEGARSAGIDLDGAGKAMAEMQNRLREGSP